MNIWLNFLIDSRAFGATFMYGSTGEIISEKAGHLNLGIPGIMCVGGAGGCLLLNIAGNKGLPPFLLVIIGVLVFELLKIILQFLGVNPYYNYVVQGRVIVLAVSLFFEFTQYSGLYGYYAHAYRTFDVDDLILNTFGAAIGACIVFLIRRKQRKNSK